MIERTHRIEQVIVLMIDPDISACAILIEAFEEANLATPTSKHPLSLRAMGSGGSAISSHVLLRSTLVSCFRVIFFVLGPSVAASLPYFLSTHS